MKGSEKGVIRVSIGEHNGLFCATSEQVPGFFLCGKDASALDADILPAMKLLLSIKEEHQGKKRDGKDDGRRSDRLVAHRELAFA